MKKNKGLPKKYRLYYYSIWTIFIIGFASVFGLFYSASTGRLGEMPDFRQLENPNTNLASQIISSDNKVLGKIHFGENRTPIELELGNWIPNKLHTKSKLGNCRLGGHLCFQLPATSSKTEN